MTALASIQITSQCINLTDSVVAIVKYKSIHFMLCNIEVTRKNPGGEDS